MVSKAPTMARQATAARPIARTMAGLVGSVFLLIGVLGFIPGITYDLGSMTFAGHQSGAKLLGLFQVSVLHNFVHLLFGVAGLAMARSVPGARRYLIGGGVIYLAFWLYGLIVNQGSTANFIPFNTADNWLHLLLGVGMITLGLVSTRGPQGQAR